MTLTPRHALALTLVSLSALPASAMAAGATTAVDPHSAWPRSVATALTFSQGPQGENDESTYTRD